MTGRCVQEYLKNYYAEKSERSAPGAGDKCLAASLGTSPTGRGGGHTILKKSLDHQHTLPAGGGGGDEGEAGEPGAASGFCHSVSLPNRRAKFRDVVEIVEFTERDKVRLEVLTFTLYNM